MHYMDANKTAGEVDGNYKKRDLFKLDEPDMQDIAGEAEMNS